MKGYKAFNKGLVCRGKRYAENTVFEEKNAEICRNGMHFCKNPLDVLDYYPLVDNKGNVTEFAEVEALDDIKTYNGKKFCTKKLKIGAKLSLSQFIKASFDVAFQNIKSQVDVEVSDGATLTGGDNIKLAAGYHAKLVGDNDATLVGGNNAKLIGGDYAKLVGDYGTTLIGGDNAELVGGNNATLVGHNDAIIAGGDYAKLVGDYGATLAGGNNAIIVGDHGSVAKGKKGSIIVLVERNDDMNIVNFKAVQVDGEKIKEDVLYKLENGKFVAVE